MRHFAAAAAAAAAAAGSAAVYAQRGMYLLRGLISNRVMQMVSCNSNSAPPAPLPELYSLLSSMCKASSSYDAATGLNMMPAWMTAKRLAMPVQTTAGRLSCWLSALCCSLRMRMRRWAAAACQRHSKQPPAQREALLLRQRSAAAAAVLPQTQLPTAAARQTQLLLRRPRLWVVTSCQ